MRMIRFRRTRRTREEAAKQKSLESDAKTSTTHSELCDDNYNGADSFDKLTESSSPRDPSLPSFRTSYHASTSSSSRPRAGSSTQEMEFVFDDDYRLVPKEGQRIRWRSLPGETLLVRSIDYQITRTKMPSPGELYQCVKVDFVESSQRLANMSSRVELPEVRQPSPPNKTWDAPDIFVVTLSLPRDPSGGKDNGPSYTICMYFVMKDDTREILTAITGKDPVPDVHPHTAAVRLFNEWCKRSPEDPKFQARFKLIPAIQNIGDLGLPSWISKWNGKPVLIKRSGKTGFLYSTDNCMEMEVTFHPFPWAAKQAIQYLREHVLHKLFLTFGFVIEGRDASELPETLIGLCQLCSPRSEIAIPADEFFASDIVKLKSVLAGEMSDDE